MLRCFYYSTTQLMCEAEARKRLLVTINPNNAWQHFQLSVSRDGNAHLKISESTTIRSFDEISGFLFAQQHKELVLCIGLCDSRYDGFNGGVRELIVQETFFLPFQANPSQHAITVYTTDVRAYFRFAAFQALPGVNLFLED